MFFSILLCVLTDEMFRRSAAVDWQTSIHRIAPQESSTI